MFCGKSKEGKPIKASLVSALKQTLVVQTDNGIAIFAHPEFAPLQGLPLSRVITQYLLKCGTGLGEENNRIHLCDAPDKLVSRSRFQDRLI